MRNAVQGEGRADGPVRAAKPALPETMTDHGHRRAGQIIRAEDAASPGRDTKSRKQISSGDHAIQFFRLAAAGQQIPPPEHAGQARERAALNLPRFKITVEKG